MLFNTVKRIGVETAAIFCVGDKIIGIQRD